MRKTKQQKSSTSRNLAPSHHDHRLYQPNTMYCCRGRVLVTIAVITTSSVASTAAVYSIEMATRRSMTFLRRLGWNEHNRKDVFMLILALPPASPVRATPSKSQFFNDPCNVGCTKDNNFEHFRALTSGRILHLVRLFFVLPESASDSRVWNVCRLPWMGPRRDMEN